MLPEDLGMEGSSMLLSGIFCERNGDLEGVESWESDLRFLVSCVGV